MNKLETIQAELLQGKAKSRQKNSYLDDVVLLHEPEILKGPMGAVECLRLLCVDKDKTIRSQTFRSMRKVLTTDNIAKAFMDAHVDVLVARALEREDKFLWERMQAMKFIKQLVEVSPQRITRSLVMALVSVASNLEDEFGKLCLDTLREVALFNPQVVSHCNAIQVLVDAILEPKCEDMASSLTFSMLYLLDSEDTRKFLRPSVDLEKLIAVFTDTDVPDDAKKDACRKASTEALVILMRSWTGIFILSSDPFGLRSIIDVLKLPEAVQGSTWASNAVADLLFEILEIVKVGNTHSALGGFRGKPRPNLLNNYIVMVLLGFINCGMIDVLTEIGVSGTGNRDIETTTTSLLSAVLNLAADLLPPSLNARLNALPTLVSLAAGFDEETSSIRIRACNMLDELSDNSDHLSLNMYADNIAPRQSSKRTGVQSLEDLCSVTDMNSNFRRYRRFTHDRRREHMVLSLRVFLDAQMEENAVQSLLRSTQVEKFKEWTKWDFMKCIELIEGPMQNAQHLSNLISKTKFVRRLLTFLKPTKKEFSMINWSSENDKYMWAVVKLLRVLAQSQEVLEMPMVVEVLSEIIQGIVSKCGGVVKSEVPVDNFWITPSSLTATLSREYLTLIGILSESVAGVKMLDSYDFFDAMVKAGEDPNLDYLTRLVAANIDYGTHILDFSKARNLMSVWLMKGSLSLRRFLITHIRLVLRASVEGFVDWGLECLVTALTTDKSLALLALDVLEEMCDDEDSLIALILKNPSFELCEEEAQTFLLRFLSVPIGFDFLKSSEWISQQFVLWKRTKMLTYVEDLEGSLVAALSEGVSSQRYAGASGRSVEEEYFFDRLNNLPWRMDILLRLGNGSEFPLASDVQVDTFPRKEGGLDIYVKGNILLTRASKRFNQIDAQATIEFSLGVGTQPSLSPIQDEQWKRTSTPMQRKVLSSQNPIIEDNNCRWEFEYTHDEEDGDVIRLKSIAILVPMFTAPNTIVSLPPHFYGEIAKTAAGLELLKTNRHFEQFAMTIRDPEASSLQKRAALWAIGHIGSSERGFEILKHSETVHYISEVARTCGTLSMRGTCFYILGLISQCESGRALLDHLGWDFPLNTALAIAVPKDIASFLDVLPGDFAGTWASDESNRIGVTKIPWSSGNKKMSSNVPKDVASSVILGHISNLGNDLVQKGSHHLLLRMQSKNPQYFASSALFYEAAKLLSVYSFPLPVRRFIWFELFAGVEFNPEDMAVFDKPFEETREYIF